jgi:hypothetical protein
MNQELISRQQADRAINQLLSVIVGRQQAIASNHLENYILERLEFSLILIEQEMNHSKRLGDTNNAMNRAQRKLSSVQSLKVLAALISEVEWS